MLPVGITAEGKVTDKKGSFELFFTNEMLDIIMRETNREGDRVYRQWNADNPGKQKKWTAVSMIEMRAFLGLLIVA